MRVQHITDFVKDTAIRRFHCFAVLGLAIAGCTARSGLPERAPVHGKVTLDGQPLTRGTVSFVPDAAKQTRGPTAIGAIEADGSYRLTTDRHSPGDGAMVGFHKVKVDARKPPRDNRDTLPEALIPGRYFQAETSQLNVEVKSGIDNDIPLVLTSEP